METVLTRDPAAAAALLSEGALVAVPTETVYGLAADGLNAAAVAAVYRCKGRPPEKPLSLLVAGEEALSLWCREVPPQAVALARRFWPGPLTLVLPARTEQIPPMVRAGGETVGLRCPDHPLTLDVLRRCGRPLAAPSANPSGAPSPRCAQEVLTYFQGEIPAVLDGGACVLGRESTVLDLSVRPFRILRQGGLAEAEITGALVSDMTILGITGGSGSGKTTALRALENLGGLAIDCDAVYHRLLREDREMLEEIRARFPAAFPDGAFARKRLGEIVFRDPAALLELNAITHRCVEREVRRILEAYALAGGRLVGIDAIALFESGLDRLCDATIGVVAPRETRIRRLMEREGITEDYAARRLNAQQPEHFYREHCTHILENNDTREAFARESTALIRRYCKEETSYV